MLAFDVALPQMDGIFITMVATAAVVTAIAAALKALPVIWDFISAAAKLPGVVNTLVNEFSPNGGNSMRDRIEHVVTEVSEARADFTDHAEKDLLTQLAINHRLDEFHSLVTAALLKRIERGGDLDAE